MTTLKLLTASVLMLRSDLRLLVLAAVLSLPACGGSETADARRAPPAAAPSATAPAVRDTAAVALESAPAEGGAVSPVPAPAIAPAAAPARGAAAPAGFVAPDGAGSQPSASAAPRESAPDAERILRRVEKEYEGVRSMQADFVQDLDVPLLGTRQRSSGKIYQRRPDRFLMKFSDPAGDIIVADGRYFWMYYPSNDRTQVMKTSIAAGSEQVDLHRQFLSDPTERYAATLTGSETVDGHDTHVLTLLPRQPSSYRQLRIWVDRDDYTVRRFEMTEENESVRRIELRNLRKNVSLPDGLFTFTPPKGTQVFDQ
jgi:outer membrane lipoprotein carrier protein